ncbi:hypothetical protein SDC9_125379 [bioreactor metagenome]|uniref:Uncharacterized protein n=1 Tax=bioreactor metagenome TaxID=1076179 RepID=A0A645CN84_9ZZZZ
MIKGLPHRVGVCDVADDREGAHAAGIQPAGSLSQGVLFQVQQGNPQGAVLQKARRHGGAQALGRACYCNNFVVEVLHGS